MTRTDLIDDRSWSQLAARDPSADGRFVYAVRTTGVFCRPSCAARKPRRENVRLFADAEAAQAAGFRPCKRCRPTTPAGEPLMAAVARYIDAHRDEALPLARLAEQAQMSPAHLQRRFTAEVGVSPRAYHQAARLAGFKRSLRDGATVTDAAADAGYGSTSRVHAQADGALGMPPSAYRAGGAGETIAWAARETPLGWLAMAATRRGVCLVEFGDGPEALAARIAAEFPRATLVSAPDDAALDGWMSALADHLAGAAPAPDLPLDLRGTAFQLSVWRFLMQVPAGAPVSYADLAAGVGKPRAVRAAASACAANRVALLVPCHRALRGDGGMGGYRWGVERKRRLLAAEGYST